MRLPARSAAFFLFAIAAAVGCAGSPDDAESDDTPTKPAEIAGDSKKPDDALPAPSAVTTYQLTEGYNSFLGRRASRCAISTSERPPSVGDVRGQFYLRHVTTKDELARDLDVSVGASVKVPQASVEASVKVVNKFRSSATTVNFLVRALRSYNVVNQSDLGFAPAASAMLAENRMADFLRVCGGSFVQAIRYEAQVIALLQFETQTVDAARNIATELGGSTPALAKNLGSASVDLKTKAEQAASKYKASMSLSVATIGFLSNTTGATANLPNESFEKFDVLRKELDTSFDRDLQADRTDYFKTQRSVRPVVITEGSYAQIPEAPRGANFTQLSATLNRADEFFDDFAGLQVRLERAYTDEVRTFLNDQDNQFRYNLTSGPKLRTEELKPIAQTWSAKLAPEPEKANGSLITPLRVALERCVANAVNGSYDACMTDEWLDMQQQAAITALNEYNKRGRIVRVSAWMPVLGKVMSYRNAETDCASVSMRMPKREEMATVGPAVMALAAPGGEVWFAGDAVCAKPFFSNGNGQGSFGCADDSYVEWLPYVADRPVVCVDRSGPIGVLSSL